MTLRQLEHTMTGEELTWHIAEMQLTAEETRKAQEQARQGRL